MTNESTSSGTQLFVVGSKCSLELNDQALQNQLTNVGKL
jgi:hypothetical protein